MSKHRKHIRRDEAHKKTVRVDLGDQIIPHFNANPKFDTVDFYGKEWELIPEPNPRDLEANLPRVFVGKKPLTLIYDGANWVEETGDNSMQKPIIQEVIDGKLYVQYPSAATHITINMCIGSPKDRHPITLEKLDTE